MTTMEESPHHNDTMTLGGATVQVNDERNLMFKVRFAIRPTKSFNSSADKVEHASIAASHRTFVKRFLEDKRALSQHRTGHSQEQQIAERQALLAEPITMPTETAEIKAKLRQAQSACRRLFVENKHNRQTRIEERIAAAISSTGQGPRQNTQTNRTSINVERTLEQHAVD